MSTSRSLMRGIGSVLDIWPASSRHRPSAVSSEAALRGDWVRVGHAIQTAIQREEKQLERERRGQQKTEKKTTVAAHR